ncbi:MAG: hypothetical protein H7123_08460, partial [Thermoleophilia bacterium]|nr:hypothetical protein [Thermoleophilia bacterium]
RHVISSSDRRAWLNDWASSARAQRKLGGSKGAQVAGARGIVTNLARRHQLWPDRLALVMAGVHATTDVMLHRGYPAREARIKLTGDAATYGFYPGYGVQLQPLFTFAEGNQLANAGNLVGATAIADRMLDFDTSKPHYRAWEYAFPWQGTELPWISGMTQATAMQFYSHMWNLTAKDDYLVTAKAAMPGFLRTASQKGVKTYDGSGRWFLLYPFNPDQRILNGHLQALIGLSDYAEWSGDTRATSLVQDGIAAVTPLLGKFDTGAWSRYQYDQEADLGYHDLMTTQFNKLSNRIVATDPTTSQIFRDYGTRFGQYRVTAPQTSVSATTSGALYPIIDGFRDTVSTSFFIDKRSTVVISVVDANETVVRTYRDSYARGTYPFAWDGHTSGHRIAPAGIYHLRIRATDIAANRSTMDAPTSLVVRADTTAPEFSHVKVAAAGAARTKFTVNVIESESGFVTVRIVRGGTVVGKAQVGKHGGNLFVPMARSKLKHVTVLVTDSSGNRATFLL